METVESTIANGKIDMEHTLQHLHDELNKVRAGKASPAMLGGVMVSYYGTPTPLSQVASITTPDGRTLSIQPWEKSLLGPIEKAIFEANLGFTPMNDGEFVRIPIPPLTQERRIQLVKQTKALGEEAKVSLRSARHKMMEFIKKEVKDGYPEDAGKRKEDEVEAMTKANGKRVEEMLVAKEKDIMTV